MTSALKTPYDDVFRTLTNDYPNLVIPISNELFQMDYTGQEIVVKTENEIFLHKQDGGEEKRITDTSLIIKRNLTDKGEGYHFECQSTKDGTLAITLIDMSKKVIRSLLGDKYPKVKKGVEDAMGGQILEYEAKTILNRGKAEGEGLLAKLISRLIDDGRNKDVVLAAKDEEARKQFYREYGMIE